MKASGQRMHWLRQSAHALVLTLALLGSARAQIIDEGPISDTDTIIPPDTSSATLSWNFGSFGDSSGWIPQFAEYNHAAIRPGLNATLTATLPDDVIARLPDAQAAWVLDWINTSDDVFAFLKKRILFPSLARNIAVKNVRVYLASSAGDDCSGIGMQSFICLR